jgi:hypothetical protein
MKFGRGVQARAGSIMGLGGDVPRASRMRREVKRGKWTSPTRKVSTDIGGLNLLCCYTCS